MKLLFYSFIILFLSACSAPVIPSVSVTPSSKQIDYLNEVKPILDKRCVVCHSCYNSPCQAKYSSYEGVDRGATKLDMYATRYKVADPTRLFVDAKNTQEWREKSFFTLTKSQDSNATNNDSIMIHLLYDKKMHPKVIGEYDPEHDKHSCPRNKEELEEYIDDKPNHGMPYGFPAISEKEYKTLSLWLLQGAKGPSKAEQEALERPSPNAAKEIARFESFLNKQDAKHVMSARYLYEHLYLAHLYFPSANGEYFELIRSSTPAPQKPVIIATRRPFDSPQTQRFYYRFRKIHSTIVHKTHMTFKLDEKVLARFNELFIKPKWDETPHVMSYDINASTNPMVEFAQIPVRSRYQFLLDNAQYIIMTFIRGPVCRGQVALNVINDHFWVMFKDPDYDLGVRKPGFLKKEAANLVLPIQSVNMPVIDVFSDAYRKKYRQYYIDKRALMKKEFSKGLDYNSIWKGNRAEDTPLLTIYRHFDSASVSRGVLGEEPRTMWVIDYAQLERIYYLLVAGYDVFGNVSHQANVRRYMDYLRFEGEFNFLDYMPKSKRVSMFESWYIGGSSLNKSDIKLIENLEDSLKYKTIYPKNEFIEHIVKQRILKSTKIVFDKINYQLPYAAEVEMPKVFESEKDFTQAMRSISRSGNNFVRYVTSKKANNIFVRLRMPDGTFRVKYLVINRWHDNVNSMFFEEYKLDPEKDTMDILSESVGSYPNVFVSLKLEELPEFLRLIKHYNQKDEDDKLLRKYFISRSDENFWKIYDWFQRYYDKTAPVESGLYDLNRYSSKVWDK